MGSGDSTDSDGTADRLSVNRILVVEAEVEEAQFLLEAMEGERDGWEVEVTFTGERALSLLDDRSFDCVIHAFDLPETHGVDLVRRLRDRGHDLPVIVRTDREPDLLKENVMAAGADAFLGKTDDASRLWRTIEDLLLPEAVPATG